MQQLKVILFILTMNLINSAPLSDSSDNAQGSATKPVTLLKFINEPFTAESPQYHYEYETSDGQTREEIGKLVKNANGVEYLFVRGSYSYTGPDGILYSIFYTADENGFQATGSHLPGQEHELPVPQFDPNAIKSLIG